MRGSFSATKPRSQSSSPLVAAASGGGGTLKSFPEEIAHVLQVPALGSICCPNAGRVNIRITPGVNHFMNRDIRKFSLTIDFRFHSGFPRLYTDSRRSSRIL